MDSKTKHRILGILVIAGLIVILLPFLQSGRELPPDAVAVKTPPFPDQSIQVTTDSPPPITTSTQVTEDVKQQPDDTIKTEHPADTAPIVPAIANPAIDKKPISQPSTNSDQKAKTSDVEPAAAIKDESIQAKKNDNVVAPTTSKTVATVAPIITPTTATVPTVKKTVVAKKVTHKEKHASYVHTPLDNNGLFKLHGAAWVIQVGSFKNKANALRVVNNLRANGYRAFIQQISTTLGDDNTRVFVGPENKQSSARELAQKLESDMHLRGIVISYKPLAL